MSNPLEGAMGKAAMAMLLENMKDIMPVQIELMGMKAQLQTEYYNGLVAAGMKEGAALFIVAQHDPFRSLGSAPDESEGPDV